MRTHAPGIRSRCTGLLDAIERRLANSSELEPTAMAARAGIYERKGAVPLNAECEAGCAAGSSARQLAWQSGGNTTGCTLCMAGMYSRGGKAAECNPCSPGHLILDDTWRTTNAQRDTWQTGCVQTCALQYAAAQPLCPPTLERPCLAFFLESARERQFRLTAYVCAAGFFASFSGSDKCSSCDEIEDQYQDSAGSSRCLHCPPNSRRDVREDAFKSIKGCVCNDGFFAPRAAEGFACIPCPPGGQCDGKLHLPYAQFAIHRIGGSR
jgi:hypothetical protein